MSEVSYILKTYFVVIQDSDQLCLDYKARCDKTLCLPCGKALHSNRCKIVNLYSAWSAKHCCTQNISLCKVIKRWRLSLGSGFELHFDSKDFQKTFLAVWQHSLWVLRNVAVYDYIVSCQIKDHWHSHNQRCQEKVRPLT